MFCIWYEVKVKIQAFLMDIKLVQNHLLKRPFFYLLHRNVTFGIVQVTVYMSAWSKAFYSYPLVHLIKFVVAQFLSHVTLFATPWTAVSQASLSFTISRRLFKLMSIESMMSSNHLILCHLLLLLPSIFPSITVFSNGQFFTSGGQSIGVSASASVLPMNIQS